MSVSEVSAGAPQAHHSGPSNIKLLGSTLRCAYGAPAGAVEGLDRTHTHTVFLSDRDTRRIGSTAIVHMVGRFQGPVAQC